jgi:ferredoxin
MSDEPVLPFRVLRRGLRAASRAGASVVERVLRNESQPAPFLGRKPGTTGRVSTGPVEVRFGPTLVRVERGATVLEAAEAAGLDLRHYCGGNCSCGTCRVVIVRGARNLSRREGMEEMVLGADNVARGDRLACQAQVHGEVDIDIPDWF